MEDFIARSTTPIDGTDGDPKACMRTLRHYWRCLVSDWHRRHPLEAVPHDLVRLITEVSPLRLVLSLLTASWFIEGPLKQALKLPIEKGPRKYAGKTLLLYVAKQLFIVD